MTSMTDSRMVGSIRDRRPLELSLVGPPNDEDAYADRAEPQFRGEVVATTSVEGLSFGLVRMPNGRFAFQANDRKSAEALNRLVGQHAFSELEVFGILGGTLDDAPPLLKHDHRLLYRGSPREAAPRTPSITLFGPSAPASTGSTQYLGCLWNNVVDVPPIFESSLDQQLDQFRNWWNYLSDTALGSYASNHHVDLPALQDIGANGVDGTGAWESGDADLNLAPTSSGAAAICYPPDSFPGPDININITVQEQLSPGIWFTIHEFSWLEKGSVYGMWFTGTVLRRIRFLIRPGTSRPFLWGGAF
jgi:hypothetical protein